MKKHTVKRPWGHMFFAPPELMDLEHEMQTIPRYGYIPPKPTDKDCPHCMYYDKKKRGCKKSFCIIEDEF